MLKPDAIQRRLVGKIISRFEERGLKIVAMKMLKIDKNLAEKHYAEHFGREFYESLLEYVTSGPVVAMVIEGQDVVEIVRTMMGRTDPKKSSPGTIRGDFALDISRNVVHGSDSKESAKREISIFFEDNEILEYKTIDEEWLGI